MPEGYITVNQMMERFNVSRSTAWKWIRDGEIPTYRFIGDRKTYVRDSDLDRLQEPILISDTKKEAA